MAKISKKHLDVIVKSGVFHNIENFSDLDERIRQIKPLNGQTLKTTQGDVFELFIEALLNVSNEFAETQNVWRVGYVPEKVRNNLSLPNMDKGYDGVYETKSGDYVSYQVKWRSNTKHRLVWNEPDHISSFVGISKKVPKLHLFASCNRVVKEYTNIDLSLIHI